MAIVSSFDQWEKDVFFSAAEEVQKSADLMESLYRSWQRDRTSTGIDTEDLEDLNRELHMSLGTAKWQLEQFQREVSKSDEKYSSEENAKARHKQFISVIETNIKRVELELNNSFTQSQKRDFTWVKLEEGEKDDFVAFLSPNPQTLKKSKERERETLKEATCKKKDEKISIQIEKSSSSNDLRENSNLVGVLKKFQGQVKVKLLRNNFWKAKTEENSLSNYLDSSGVTNFSQFGKSLRVTFLLLLSIFLIVPFVIYSSG